MLEDALEQRFDASDDSGFALPLVLMVAVILFILATMVIGLTTYRTTAVKLETSRQQAMYLADKGINSMLVQLRSNPSSITPISGVGPTGSYLVTASVGGDSSSSLVNIRSTGTLAKGTQRTIMAQVTFKKFSDYAAISDDDISIGPGATENGDVRSNNNVWNDGIVTGKIWAGRTIYGTHGHSGTNNPLDQENCTAVAFSAISNSLAAMKVAANVNSPDTYWGSLPAGSAGNGKSGYQVVLNGLSATISTVTALNSGPVVRTTKNPQTLLLPPNGIIYFDDNVYVSGTYSAYVTIVAADPIGDTHNPRGNVYIAGNIVPNPTTGVFTDGIIAQNSIYDVMESAPDQQEIYGALLAQNGWITTSGSASRSRVDYYGTAGAMLGIARAGNFTTRNYRHWSLFDTNPPPMEPPLGTGQFGLKMWMEGH